MDTDRVMKVIAKEFSGELKNMSDPELTVISDHIDYLSLLIFSKEGVKV